MDMVQSIRRCVGSMAGDQLSLTQGPAVGFGYLARAPSGLLRSDLEDGRGRIPRFQTTVLVWVRREGHGPHFPFPLDRRWRLRCEWGEATRWTRASHAPATPPNPNRERGCLRPISGPMKNNPTLPWNQTQTASNDRYAPQGLHLRIGTIH